MLPDIKTAALAMGRVVVNVVKGEALLVSNETLAAREAVCKQCPRREVETNRCLECTCYLSMKTQLTSEKCPLGKWEI